MLEPKFISAERVWKMDPQSDILVNRLRLFSRITELCGYGKNPTLGEQNMAEEIREILKKYPEDQKYVPLKVREVTRFLIQEECSVVTFLG